jgi:succinate dehydrogenase/fumarate reductase cytochrome b subunit
VSTQSRLVGAGLLFLFIFLSGFWLSGSGNPYNVAASTIHKLLGVGAAVLLVVTMVQVSRVGRLSGIQVVAAVVTGLLFLSLVASGGLLMIEREVPAAVQKVHHIAPYLTVLSTAASLYLLMGRG